MKENAERLFDILETVVTEARDWLPRETGVGSFHSANERLSPVTRTRLAFLEDNLQKARSLVETQAPVRYAQNPNCDGSHCLAEKGQVRMLPLDRSGQGNIHVCRACHGFEMTHRQERNKKLAKENQFKLPEWESLKIAYE